MQDEWKTLTIGIIVTVEEYNKSVNDPLKTIETIDQ